MWFAIFLNVILCNMNHHEAAYIRGGEKVLNPFATLLVSVNKAFHTGWNSEGAASPPLCHWLGLLLFPERFWQKGKTKVQAESMRLWDKLDAVCNSTSLDSWLEKSCLDVYIWAHKLDSQENWTVSVPVFLENLVRLGWSFAWCSTTVFASKFMELHPLTVDHRNIR